MKETECKSCEHFRVIKNESFCDRYRTNIKIVTNCILKPINNKYFKAHSSS